jgi:hypothetical protein
MKKITFFLFFILALHCRTAFPQYLHESLSLFNNLLPELKNDEKLLLGLRAYSNFEDKPSNPKSLNHYYFVSRFKIKKDNDFLEHFEFGLNLNSFFAFRNSPAAYVSHCGAVTVTYNTTDAFGGYFISPELDLLTTFNLATNSKLTIAYLHRKNILSDHINLQREYKSGHDLSIFLKLNKFCLQTLWRTRYNPYCKNYRDTVADRNYSLPAGFRSILLTTASYSDSIDRKVFMKQYISGFFTRPTDNLLETPNDTIHSNAIIFGMMFNFDRLLVNPEYSANFVDIYNANNITIPVKFRSFSLLAGYRFKRINGMIGFTRTHYFYPTICNLQFVRSDWNYFLFNFGINYIL